MRKIVEAAAGHAKWWGLPATNAEAAALFTMQCARFFNLGGDFGLFREGFLRLRQEFDRVLG